MAPHNVAVLTPPRTLAHVLLELKEARRDWEEALSAAEHAQAIDDDNAADEFGDRATEADNRIDDLREEFASRFEAATGLTWKQVEKAIEDAVL
jgi:hypothetical protein